MYKVLLDGNVIHSLNSPSLALTSGKLNIGLNKAGSFTFTMSSTHPYYDKITPLKSIIKVYQNDELLFYGFPVLQNIDFYLNKTVVCDGELSSLNYTIQEPAKYTHMPLNTVLNIIIGRHNSQRGTFPYIYSVGQTSTNFSQVIDISVNYETTLEAIKKIMAYCPESFMKINRVSDTNQTSIDFVGGLGYMPHTNSQEIRLGRNILEIAQNFDYAEIVSGVVPLGARGNTAGASGERERLNISSVNDGKTYLENTDLIELYGKRRKAVVFENITDATQLKSAGEKWLNNQYSALTIECKAIDLNLSDNRIEQLRLADVVHVIAQPHGIGANNVFMISELEIDILTPKNNVVVLGMTDKKTLSEQSASMQSNISRL